MLRPYDGRKGPARGSAFHRDLDVPLPRRSLTRGLFGLIQVDVSDLLRERTLSSERNRSNHGHVFAGMGSSRHLRRRAGDGGRGYSAALLSDLGGGLRSPGARSKISADISGHTGAWTSCGRWPLFCWLKRSGLGRHLPRRPRFCMCRFPRERCCGWRIQPTNLDTIKMRAAQESCSPKLRITV